MDLAVIEAERARLRAEYVKADRPPSSARGIHHTALLSSDVERTIRFYQGVLEFPLTEIIENRDYAGSNHFFFDVGHGNLLAFFDFPGLDHACDSIVIRKDQKVIHPQQRCLDEGFLYVQAIAFARPNLAGSNFFSRSSLQSDKESLMAASVAKG